MSKFRVGIVTALFIYAFSVWVAFFVIDTKTKNKIISLKDQIKEIEKSQTEEETYNGITLKMWVKTKPQYGERIAGKVISFKFRGEAYPIAVLKGGKEISVFWLVPMKTQRG